MKKFEIRQFTCMTKFDYNKFMKKEFKYQTFLATMFNDFLIKVNDKMYSNKEFYELFTTNLL